MIATRRTSRTGKSLQCRDHIAGLLLLPADVNRSLQAKRFEEGPVYASQNLYAASLTDNAYLHQPQFRAFRERTGLPFKPYSRFGKNEQAERRALVIALVKEIWSPGRLKEVLS